MVRAIRGGLSLLETVIALFLMSAAILLVVNLMHASLRHKARLEKRTQATLLASRAMADLRSWARDSNNFATGWAGKDGTTWSEPDVAGYQLRLDCPAHRRAWSPCEPLEAPWDALSNARKMDSSLMPVRVTVSWDPTDPAARVQLFSYIGEPERTASTLVVTPTALAGIPQWGFFTLAAQVQDGSGAEIRDVMFEWNVDSGTGNATITPTSARDGRTVTIQHVYQIPGFPQAPRPGTIRVRCTARYRGQMLKRSVGPFTLL
ncbi:MAG: hypothetical protein AB1758_12250 [Candidatus Eremiobacterota bacterium]